MLSSRLLSSARQQGTRLASSGRHGAKSGAARRANARCVVRVRALPGAPPGLEATITSMVGGIEAPEIDESKLRSAKV
jgi:hypothetical protein